MDAQPERLAVRLVPAAFRLLFVGGAPVFPDPLVAPQSKLSEFPWVSEVTSVVIADGQSRCSPSGAAGCVVV